MQAGLGFGKLGRHVLACLSLRLAFHNVMLFMNAVATLLQLPALCLLPFWCGGLCVIKKNEYSMQQQSKRKSHRSRSDGIEKVAR